jgi:dipeptidyl aminopeptidase/acylaminoacyl peptidase
VTLLAWTSWSWGQGRVYRDRVEPHWFAEGARFWYRNDLKDGAREFVLVDAQKGMRAVAFDHGRVAAGLSELTKQQVSAARLPVEQLEFEADGMGVVLRGREKSWRLDLRSYALEERKQGDLSSGSLPAMGQPRASRQTGAETEITFVNRTGADVEIFWMDTEGEKRRYATVKAGGEWAQHTFAGHVWLAADKAGKALGVFEASVERSTAVVDGQSAATRPTGGEARRRGGGFRRPESPDGRWVVSVKNNNLWIGSKDGEEFALSQDGKTEDGYSLENIWWSPDSRKLAAMRVEKEQEHKVYLVESSPKDQLQPKLRTLDYLKPGDRIAHPRPRLFQVEERRAVALKDELFATPWSINEVRWAADSSRFTFVYNQRGHQALRVVAVDAMTGGARAIVDERSATFICYSGKYFCEWVGEGEIIWMSERDGWNHLWLVDAQSGQVKNQITKGEWVVQSVVNVDREKRRIWFRAGGVRAGQDPYYTHLCRVNFDGTGMVVLTEGEGTHSVPWTPGSKYLIDTWSRVDQPPVNELRSAEDGRLVCKLEEADAGEVLAERGGRWPERFVAKGRDGKTDIYGVVIFPRDFDARRKYPVVENIYAGPQGFFAPKSFRARYGHQQQIADRGMIVVQCDGMGTSGRSKAFHDVCFRDLRDAGFADRIAWMKAAAAKVPQMDLSRVGIYGGSAGGQNAMAALLWHGDFYKVAVADCGCHDNRMDKIWWNEQWMGWPVGKHYEENSNVANAQRLQGKLMLVFGELDSNVDPASTMQVVNALEKADKDFDLVIVTGTGHGSAETPYGSRRRVEFLTRNLTGQGLGN